MVDTGGLLLEDEDRFVPLIRSQAEVAIKDGDAVAAVSATPMAAAKFGKLAEEAGAEPGPHR